MADRVAALVAQVGTVLLDLRSQGLQHWNKSDGSVVTNADIKSEQLIQQGLRHHFPHIPFVGEEGLANGTADSPGEQFWLVDPVDSTSSYLRGSDEFAICVALVEHGVPTLGVIGAPAWNKVFVGIVPTQASYKLVGSHKQVISCRVCPHSDPVVMVSSNMGFDPDAPDPRIPPQAEFVKMNSALKFVQVAQGEADFYPRGDRLGEYDVAAGDALVRAAGGSCTDWNQQRLVYTGLGGVYLPPFVCSGISS